MGERLNSNLCVDAGLMWRVLSTGWYWRTICGQLQRTGLTAAHQRIADGRQVNPMLTLKPASTTILEDCSTMLPARAISLITSARWLQVSYIYSIWLWKHCTSMLRSGHISRITFSKSVWKS